MDFLQEENSEAHHSNTENPAVWQQYFLLWGMKPKQYVCIVCDDSYCFPEQEQCTRGLIWASPPHRKVGCAIHIISDCGAENKRKANQPQGRWHHTLKVFNPHTQDYSTNCPL